ncbi:MAG: polymorphic toxin type 50 domain-containing protein [Jatrophihabitans sp.]
MWESTGKAAGSGQPVNNIPPGQANFKERVDYGKEIGVHVARDGTRSPTTVANIVYAADGTVHIIPARPRS